jgi:hypothetical protein
MPFDEKFDDIYKFGIKGAAEDAGAYAERVDEQIFIEGMLDRIFNQINKADVIIADMTGKNPNVFYEVGYAHALNKVVLLITQSADDIPFDLKHRQHIVYGGRIEQLRTELSSRIVWGVAEAERRRIGGFSERFSVRLNGVELKQGLSSAVTSEINSEVRHVQRQLPGQPALQSYLEIQVRNGSETGRLEISHVYLFAEDGYRVAPVEERSWADALLLARPFRADPSDAPDDLAAQFRLPVEFPPMPPRTTEANGFTIGSYEAECTSTFRLRFHTLHSHFDFPFRLVISKAQETPEYRSVTPLPEHPSPTQAE